MTLVEAEAPDFSLESTAGEVVRLTETLHNGPTVVLMNRGYWCSYCAEQLQTFSHLSYDMWRHLDVDILPVFGDPIPRLIEMRDRFGLKLQLLTDPSLDTPRQYAGVEEHSSRGLIPRSGTFIVDMEGVVRYEDIGENQSVRTYANYVRHFIRNGYERPYESA